MTQAHGDISVGAMACPIFTFEEKVDVRASSATLRMRDNIARGITSNALSLYAPRPLTRRSPMQEEGADAAM
ncbi:hypothetical protein DWU98_12360 [Dyella monticola]|uniref:Uncharacterized protein n=1 Tax=Dyella monticola TaxID=1927958 RepID=A0A370WXG1_9GAMM|nr:hypothetical protein DWU98_12360 [Dyella monticola]